jgi:hypothetical protein
MTSIPCCTGNGTPCGCQFTRAELKTKENRVYIYCKDNNPLICGTCFHGTGFHPLIGPQPGNFGFPMKYDVRISNWILCAFLLSLYFGSSLISSSLLPTDTFTSVIQFYSNQVS